MNQIYFSPYNKDLDIKKFLLKRLIIFLLLLVWIMLNKATYMFVRSLLLF
nr:MAG TPA: hypothetical protein [Caudoviricetes sp.]